MNNARILIVDDQDDIRLLLQLVLEPLCNDLHVASNGMQALQMAKAIHPDLVVLDVTMPGGIDGFQVCKALRADPATARTYVILLSARGQKSDIDEGKRAGADYYMLKPFSPQELIEIIQQRPARA